MAIKTVFMGTPDFSVNIVQALVDNGFDVTAVVTKQDKEAGRGKKITSSPVKLWAQEKGIDIYQPKTARAPEFIELMENIAPQLIVTAAIGLIIPKEILDIPQYGCINVHASLLPQYRGASPIQQSLLNGDTQTGVTVMYMSEQIDDGDIIFAKELDILEDDNCGTLFDKLAVLGGQAMGDLARLLADGKPMGTPQDHSRATYCKKIPKELGNIDWSMDGKAIVNLIRGMTPSPGAYTFLNGKRVKIVSAKSRVACTGAHPGSVSAENKFAVTVACGDGFVDVLQLQPEGKSVQSARDFLNGNKITSGTVFERNIN